MQKLIPFWVVLLAIVTARSQNCVNEPTYGNPENIVLENKPNPVTFKQMLGINAGREWDQIYFTSPSREQEVDFTKVVSFPRIFHEMQRDYANVPNQNGDPNASFTPANFPNGPLLNAGINNYSEFFGMNDNFQSFRLWYQHFKSELGDDFNGFMMSLTVAPFAQRAFPVGWYTSEEWGGGVDPFQPDANQIKSNAKNYIINFVKTYCPKSGDPDCPGFATNNCPCMIDALEIGNEPWGYVNAETYHGIVDGIIEGLIAYYGSEVWPFDLIPGAFQAYREELPNNDQTPPNGGDKASFRDDMNRRISCAHESYFSGVNVHPYSFEHGGYSLTAYPEKEGIVGLDDGSEMQHLKNAIKWCSSNMPGGKVYVTEYGWDSQVVGESMQANYIIRSTLLMARMGVHRAVLYEGLDSDGTLGGGSGKTSLFESCGLWQTGEHDRVPQTNGAKKSYRALQKLRQLLGDKTFLQALQEQDGGACTYLLGNAEGFITHMVSWLAAEGSTGQTISTIYLPEDLELVEDASSKWLDDDIDIDGTGKAVEPPILEKLPNNGVKMEVASIPILIPVKNTSNCRYLEDGSLHCGDIVTSPCDEDNIPPEFYNCPLNIMVTATDAESSVTWQPPTATDNCSGVPQISSNYQPGDLFPIGSTTVMYEAKDDAENKSNCSFEVIIQLETAELELIMPGDITLTADENGMAYVEWMEPLAESDCMIADEEPGDCPDSPSSDYLSLGAFEDNQYYLSTFQQNWTNAKIHCEERGWQLTDIERAEENEWLRSSLLDHQVWIAFIGLSDESQDGIYTWASGSNATFENWDGGQAPGPNNETDYTYMGAWTTGPWYSANQWVEKPFVCELNCNGGSVNSSPVVWRTDTGLPNGTNWPVGEYTVSYMAEDACGNSVTESFTISITANEPPPPPPNEDCEDTDQEGYTFLGSRPGSQYFLSEGTKNWEDAATSCQSIGGNLATISDEAENVWLRDQLKAQGNTTALIGLSDRATDASFEWFSGEPISYTNWDGAAPGINGATDYVYMGSWTTGPWYLANQWVEKSFICEVPCASNFGQPFIDGEHQFQDFIVFPNPASDVLFVKFKEQTFRKLIVTDISGKVIIERVIPEGEFLETLDVSKLSSGLYSIQLEGPIGKQTGRFVK